MRNNNSIAFLFTAWRGPWRKRFLILINERKKYDQLKIVNINFNKCFIISFLEKNHLLSLYFEN